MDILAKKPKLDIWGHLGEEPNNNSTDQMKEGTLCVRDRPSYD